MNNPTRTSPEGTGPMNEDQAIELGEFLHSARMERGLSSRALARMTFMNDVSILRLEQGAVAAPAPDKLVRISEALGLDMADVFALAGYAAPTQLPTWRPYLRAKYAELPVQAVDELESFFGYLKNKYGADIAGPINGEDELPEQTVPTSNALKHPKQATSTTSATQPTSPTTPTPKRAPASGRSPTP
jgi:transcriptional regulator with XRE-family HTH domain